MPLKVAPSVIAGDQSRLGDEVRAITTAGADLVHLDVMDGHFVPNLTLGPGIVQALRAHSGLPFDCHLMLAEPERYVDAFVDAGADRVSVHVEVPGVEMAIARIRARGRQVGITLNPETPVSRAAPLLARADFVLVMTVHPGFYGQKLIPEALDKLRELRDACAALGQRLPIQVDGGVNLENVSRVADAGADEVVAGAAVFKATDYRAAIEALRRGGAGA